MNWRATVILIRDILVIAVCLFIIEAAFISSIHWDSIVKMLK